VYSKGIDTMADKPKSYFMTPLEPTHLSTLSRWFSDLDDLALFDRAVRVPLAGDALRNSWFGQSEAGAYDRHWFSVAGDDAVPVAMIGLEYLSFVNGDAIVPMFIDKAFRRQGLGVRCLSLVMEIAFRHFGLHRLTSYLRADNQASRMLTERVGFQQEGCMRQAWFADGQRRDILAVGILRQEWMERRTALADETDSRTVVTFGSSGSGRWSWPPVTGRNGSAGAVGR
jgi:RimJ/RimL family protein N-acetyltransferase